MKNRVEFVRSLYPVGTRIILIKMDDPQAPPKGTKGTVTGIDDLGDLLVDWDNGSGLKAILGKDQFIHDDGDDAVRFFNQEDAERHCWVMRVNGEKPEMIIRNWGDGCVEFIVRLRKEVTA